MNFGLGLIGSINPAATHSPARSWAHMKMLGPLWADAACWNFDAASCGRSTTTLMLVSLVNFFPISTSPLYDLSELIQICSVPFSSARACPGTAIDATAIESAIESAVRWLVSLHMC